MALQVYRPIKAVALMAFVLVDACRRLFSRLRSSVGPNRRRHHRFQCRQKVVRLYRCRDSGVK